MTLRIGSLFSGYGGLDLGVCDVLDARVAWHVENDKAASKILAHHWPDVPNYGDITTVNWAHVEPVDVLTGGFPCQDVSTAGGRQGIRPGTRSGLWAHMAHAISVLQPSLVVIENVRGLLSATAHSDVEPCPWCVGDDPDGALRALGAVLGDLADIRYDARWHSVRAADVGAPHGRFRVFVIAYPVDQRHEWAGTSRDRRAGPTDDHRGTLTLLPTPAVNDMGEGKTVEAWDEWTAKMQAAHGNGNGHGKSLAIEAQRLLPTPTHRDYKHAGDADRYDARSDERAQPLTEVAAHADWGQYAAAIERWETLTRPAPAPTQLSTRGAPQLAPAFSEWLMGLPHGHVTDVPGLSRGDMLRALGNGVVPQQATAALRLLLDIDT